MDKNNIELIRREVDRLQEKWFADLRSNGAGGNSKDNERLIKLRVVLETLDRRKVKEPNAI